jgi:hypothetical protein
MFVSLACSLCSFNDSEDVHVHSFPASYNTVVLVHVVMLASSVTDLFIF